MENNNIQKSEKEIKVKELLQIIWKFKKWIISFVFTVSIITVVVSLMMDNIYASSVTLKPNNGNTDKMSSIMSSFGGLASFAGINLNSGGEISAYNMMNTIMFDSKFLYDFVEKYKYEEKIFDDYESLSKRDKFKENKRFAINKKLQEDISFYEDKKSGLIILSYQNKDRFFTQQFVMNLMKELSMKYKQIEIYNINEQIKNYRKEMRNTDNIVLQNKISELIFSLIQTKVVSESTEYYGFNVITFPSVSDKLDKIYPRRSIICIVAFMLSSALACAVAIGYELNKKNSMVKDV